MLILTDNPDLMRMVHLKVLKKYGKNWRFRIYDRDVISLLLSKYTFDDDAIDESISYPYYLKDTNI